MELSLTAATVPGNYAYTYISAPLLVLFYRWEIFVLTAVLLNYSRGIKRPAIFWLLLFPTGFLAGNFTRILWFGQLSSVYLLACGLFCMRSKMSGGDVCFPDSYTAWGGFLSGLAIGLGYYGDLTVSVNLLSLPFHVIAALLPATLAIVPALVLAYTAGQLKNLLHNKLPIFALLSGGAELLRSFWE